MVQVVGSWPCVVFCVLCVYDARRRRGGNARVCEVGGRCNPHARNPDLFPLRISQRKRPKLAKRPTQPATLISITAVIAQAGRYLLTQCNMTARQVQQKSGVGYECTAVDV